MHATQASKLPAAVDRAWEAVGGGPADLFFPEVRWGLPPFCCLNKHSIICHGITRHDGRVHLGAKTGVPGGVERGVGAQLREAAAGAGLCARRPGAHATSVPDAFLYFMTLACQGAHFHFCP